MNQAKKAAENEYVYTISRKNELTLPDDDMYFTESTHSSRLPSVTVERSIEGEYSLGDDGDCTYNVYCEDLEAIKERQKPCFSKTKTRVALIVLPIIILAGITVLVMLLTPDIVKSNGSMAMDSNETLLVWGEWGECNAKCGGGRRSRKQQCSSSRCPGKDYKLEKCNTIACKKGSGCSSISVELGNPSFLDYSELRGNYAYLKSTSYYGEIYENQIGAGWYIYNSTKGHWGIGNSFPLAAQQLYHETCESPCPTECPQDWQYWNKAQHRWKVDKRITVSCANLSCCTSLSLTSTGLSKQQWPEAFGVYEYIGKDDDGGNIYSHNKSKSYIVRDHETNTWKVAGGYGKSRSYYFLNKYHDGYFCPEHARKENWKYYSNDEGKWRIDHRIKLLCNKEV
jgi:hypothetical protein